MAEHPRASDQHEADAAVSKGCFDFLKKKQDDLPPPDVVITHHHPQQQQEPVEDNKPEEKQYLAEKLYRSDSSSSDEEEGENGEKKEKKKKKGLKEKVFGDNKEDGAVQYGTEEVKAEEKKSIVEKIKEKLPARGHEQPKGEQDQDADVVKEKGFMEKIKDKLPGGDYHGNTEPVTHHQDNPDKEKGLMEKMKEKLTGHSNSKHDDNNDEKKKET